MVANYESGGQEFESLRARHQINDLAGCRRLENRLSLRFSLRKFFSRISVDAPSSRGARDRLFVSAQVGYPAHDRRRDFAKLDGSQVRASMMFQPCFLAVEKKERMSAKSIAPSAERKPPEIFWRSFIMRPSRSA